MAETVSAIAKGAKTTPDTPAHLSMQPAMEPQSCMVFSQGWPSGQQSAGAALSATSVAALAWTKPPARGSMATAKTTKETRIVRKMLMASSQEYASSLAAVKQQDREARPAG